MILLQSSAFFVLISEQIYGCWFAMNIWESEWALNVRVHALRAFTEKSPPKWKLSHDLLTLMSTESQPGKHSWNFTVKKKWRKPKRKWHRPNPSLRNPWDPKLIWKDHIYVLFKTKLFTAAAELKATHQLKWVHELEGLNKHLFGISGFLEAWSTPYWKHFTVSFFVAECCVAVKLQKEKKEGSA